jgi:putative hydrolase of the HAD superfamily
METHVNGIKAVFFDLGKVILHFSHEDIIDRLTSEAPAANSIMRAALFDYLFDERDGLCNLYDAGRVSSKSFFDRISLRFDMGLTYGEFIDLWNDIFTENEDVSEVVREVNKKLPVFLLSNINELHWEYIRSRYSILNDMDGLVLSYKVGAKKPNPAIYDAALKCAWVGRGESLFIDDLPSNIDAARECGMEGLVFQGVERLKFDLARLGLI